MVYWVSMQILSRHGVVLMGREACSRRSTARCDTLAKPTPCSQLHFKKVMATAIQTYFKRSLVSVLS